MENTDEKVLDELPILEKLLQEVINLVDETLHSIKINEKDAFGLMCVSFVIKQKEHANSILILKTRKDVGLIARSMLEGIVLLKWVEKNKKRASRWMAYAWIEDWRLLRQKDSNGEHIQESSRKEIEIALKKYGERFYNKEAKECKKRSKPLPDDPYVHNWLGPKLYTIFNDVEESITYGNLYSRFSDWHHWNIKGIGQMISRTDQSIKFSTESNIEFASALSAAFKSLLETLNIIDKYFSCEQSDRISDLLNEFCEWFKE
ncbi:hypothetical protein HUU42_08055 [bacterium]|nr:hypothetical protein [bacterium]